MLDRLLSLETFGIKLGLENISRLCEGLGHPERSFASLHVAGTNGKGSVTAMAHSALRASGLRTARYTSPHLADITERFVIDDAPVDAATFDQVARDVLDLADDLARTGALRASPTFFEATTAIAFELFRRARTQVAVIEVGLGGRFDATNVIAPAGRRHHHDRLRPPAAPGPHAGRDRLREGRHHQAGDAGRRGRSFPTRRWTWSAGWRTSGTPG